jgi:membrane associated rhomboid family serine protease
MLRGLFGNLQPVVKNLLIINLLFFLATMVLYNKGIYLVEELGLFYPDSYDFKPYQFATHFFMHSDQGLRHIIFNMLALLVFGNMLEKVIGAKKFLIFYFATAIGAAFIHLVSEGIEIYNLTDSFFPFKDGLFGSENSEQVASLNRAVYSPTVGASGAIYGLIVAAAMYFPNTKLYLYAILPIKVKWLAAAAIAFDVISVFKNSPEDHTAHFAHLGGALIGFIIVYFWRKNSSTFY